MSLPPELGIPKLFVAKQTRCVYGTRDTGMIWEQCYRDALERVGFISGVSDPCLFHNVGRDVSVVVHGDVFTAMGTDTDLVGTLQSLNKCLKSKCAGVVAKGLKRLRYGS